MATGHSDFTHGQMPVEAQSGTFSGFMNWTVYGGALVALIVILPTLVFCTPLGWFASLITTVIVGIVLGLALKLKGGWYALVIGLAVVICLISALISALV